MWVRNWKHILVRAASQKRLQAWNTVSELQPSALGAQIVGGKLLNRATKQDINNWVKEL